MNIIIGGTKGLGYEIAQSLRANGEEAFVTGRTYEKDKHGEGRVLDLANDEDVESFARFIREEIAVDGLKRFFWVAGYGYLGEIEALAKHAFLAPALAYEDVSTISALTANPRSTRAIRRETARQTLHRP